MPGIRIGVGEAAAGDAAGAVLNGAGFGTGATAGLEPGAVAINFASSAIRSSDLSAGSDICCGLAGGID
jgi:hypothetical protein